jgi:uracil-DNA glycosylase family 4
MIVGEAPGYEEEKAGIPFVGPSGQELNRMLTLAGIDPGSVYKTNVCRVRPPGNDIDHFMPPLKRDITADMIEVKGRMVKPCVLDGMQLLEKEISLVKPDLIIAAGNVALWALTGNWGIRKWRGSQLRTSIGLKILPTLHPAAVLREWSIRPIVLTDLRRAKAWLESDAYAPNKSFIIRPSFSAAKECLQTLWARLNKGSFRIAADIETRAGHTACTGLAWSRTEALCIPWMCVEREDGYWPIEEEAQLQWWLMQVLTHPNAKVVWQNGIYDIQYIYRHNHYVPQFSIDTMWQQHTALAGMPKGLDFLSSMYCDFHLYWKDDGKEWHQKLGEDQLWAYNCDDCVVTYEVSEVLEGLLATTGLQPIADFQHSMFRPVFRAMAWGIRRDPKVHAEMEKEVAAAIEAREKWIESACGHRLNVGSPLQMKRFFYEDLQQPVILSRSKKGKKPAPTLDDEALSKLGNREPLLLPLLRRIQELRSLRVYRGTFIEAQPDEDGRIRCSYNVAGTETYRLASSTSAFDSGMNLQNIPAGGQEDENDPDKLVLPNIRKLFVPDVGYCFFDLDLDRADLQVVVWEAEDTELKLALRRGLDMHLYHARDLYKLPIPDDELIEGTEVCDEHKRRYKPSRQKCKVGIHATNYLAQPKTVAAALGITVHEADKFQKGYFGAHPGIPRWHQRVLKQLTTRGYIENRFGYRRYYFDRADSVASEAVAWTPQSTVAIAINRIWKLFDDQLASEGLMVLMQVHDSLAGQFKHEQKDYMLRRMKELAATVVIPYDDPLIIPVGIKTSPVSWGACK